MAPNVCPVCKTFSSISNTALNAHMDWCLVMEMDTNWVGVTTPKAMVKPRKRRLIEDIYATAPRCTLDDIERKNGTSRPSELALVSLVAKVVETPNLLQVETKDSKSEGAVCVDSNGANKLWIVSKFDDSSELMPREEFRSREKIFEGLKDQNALLINKKKHLFPKNFRTMNSKLKKRKLSVLDLLKSKALLSTPEIAHEEIYVEDEGSQIQLSCEQDQIFKSESTSLRNWQCSKRSGLSKRSINKNFEKSMDHQKTLETEKPASTLVAESNIMKAYLRCTTNEFAATSKQKFLTNPKTNNIMVEEKPMDGQAISELECGGVKSQAVTMSAIESSACGDLRPDILKEKHSRIPAPHVPLEDSSLVIDREPSESPASCASTVASPPRKSHSISFDANIATRFSVARDNVSLQQVFKVVNERTQSINLLRNQQAWMRLNEQLSNCQTTSLELPPGSILTRSCSDSGLTNPSCGTTALSSSTSFLRLMGKNLVVMKAEEADWLSNVHYSNLDNNINVPPLPAALGFSSYGGVQNRLASHNGMSPALWIDRGSSWKCPAPFFA